MAGLKFHWQMLQEKGEAESPCKDLQVHKSTCRNWASHQWSPVWEGVSTNTLTNIGFTTLWCSDSWLPRNCVHQLWTCPKRTRGQLPSPCWKPRWYSWRKLKVDESKPHTHVSDNLVQHPLKVEAWRARGFWIKHIANHSYSWGLEPNYLTLSTK